MAEGLRVGEVAARSGFSRKALRVYEARGILPTPRRTPSGYRLYPADILRLLAFVTDARRLGLTLAEINHIVAIRRAGSPCVHVRSLLEQKAAALEGVLKELRRILRSWRADAACAATVCPNIETKGGETQWTSAQSRFARRARPARKSR
jgi:MerR family copper efflux transcriptional regulator